MTPVSILFLDHTAKMGGGEIALLNLISALDRARFEPVIVLASDGPLAGKLRDAGVETHVLPLDPSVVEARKDSLGWRSLLRARQAALCIRYAIRLACWARRRGVRVIHANSLKADLYGGLAGRLAGIPTLWHVRDNVDAKYLPPAVAAAFRWLARVVPQVVVANSESTLRVLEASRGQSTAVVYSGTTRVVHDGWAAPAPPPAPPELEGEMATGPIISLVGRIAPWKGQHVFLQAAARVLERFPAARFWIIGAPLFGEHDYERSLHALADALGIAGQVMFWGFREDVPALLERTDILVHASTLGEPFGQVVIEGMAAGKPVIATDGGALPEIVLPGETGLLVRMGDAADMASAVAALLTDPAWAAAMGAAGRRRVQERFTITQTARKVEEVYDQMLARRRDPRRGKGDVENRPGA